MELEHLLLKAATTVATDQGEFEAVISTATIDRDGDIVEPSALVAALKGWADLGKKVPLAWSHARETTSDGKINYVTVGHIDPATARVSGREVVAKGWIDQAAQHGKEAWRLVKSGTLSFSYGFLVPEGGATKRQGASRGNHIHTIDIYEISIVPIGPANNDTRVLSWKAMTAPDGTMLDNTDDDATETPLKAIADAIEELQEFVTGEQVEGDSADVQQAERLITNLQALMRTEMGQGDDGKALRKRADELALELAADGTEGNAPTPQPDQLQELKGELAALAAQVKELAEAQKESVDATGKETQSRSVDPLRQKADALALEFASDGESLRKPPKASTPTPRPLLSPEELREQTRALTLSVLSGVDEP